MSSGQTQSLKALTDYGPVLVFFGAYMLGDLFVATAALMVTTAIALIVSYVVDRRIPMLPLITAAIIGVFGGLTLWLNDETFIKLKPTIVQGLIAFVLFGGLAYGKSLLKPLIGAAWSMNEEGWRRLTMRFALFFAAMAVLNELVWRTQTTDVWVSFKVFGLMGLTFTFGLAQLPLLNRYHIPDQVPKTGSN